MVGNSKKASAPAAQTSGTTKSVHYEIKPYNGVGSTVLKSGTLLDLTGKDAYTDPSDVVGHIDAAGTWYIVRSEGNAQ